MKIKRSTHLAGLAVCIAGALALAPAAASAREVAGQTDSTMMWKYTARCALRADQTLEVPVGPGGRKATFKGLLGVAPEWHGGICDQRCQEKVSACLFALTNRTGKHVAISLLSAAPSMGAKMLPNEDDRAFPHQEGAFFGNAFSGEAYACHGHAAATKGPERKRFCATEPESCSGLADFADAGSCDDACDLSCTRLSDGTERCVAIRCHDPSGRTWDYPITAYLKNGIEAGNADAVEGAAVAETDQALVRMRDGGRAIFRRVDFGGAPGAVHAFVANLEARGDGGRIEVWLDGRRRLGVLPVRDTAGAAREQATPVDARGVSGPHNLVLRFAGLRARARLGTIELR